MTRTKRRRIYVEDERPVPGDVVELLARTTMFSHLKRFDNHDSSPPIAGALQPEQLMLVLAVDEEWFDMLMVMTVPEIKFGWIKNRQVQVVMPCR